MSAPKEVVAALDDAMRAYSKAIADDRYVAGWTVVMASVGVNDVESTDEGILCQSAPGQRWSQSLGLIVAGNDHYRGIGVTE